MFKKVICGNEQCIYIHRHIHEKDQMCLQVAPSARPVRQCRPGSPALPMTGGMMKRMGRRRWRRWRRRKRRQGRMGSAARSLRAVNTACDGRATSAGDSLFTCLAASTVGRVQSVAVFFCSDDSTRRPSLAWGADIFFSSFFFADSSSVPVLFAYHLLPSISTYPQLHWRSTRGGVRSLVGSSWKGMLHWCWVTSVMFSNSCSDARYTANHMLCLFWFKICRKPPVMPVLIEETQETTCYACCDSRDAGNHLLCPYWWEC